MLSVRQRISTVHIRCPAVVSCDSEGLLICAAGTEVILRHAKNNARWRSSIMHASVYLECVTPINYMYGRLFCF